MCLFFFFKQKTAYEMRISDWSSDVCSSDLGLVRLQAGQGRLDLVEALPVARGAADAAIDHQFLGFLGDIRIKIVAHHPVDGLDLPVLGMQVGAGRAADDTGIVDRKSTRLNSSH